MTKLPNFPVTGGCGCGAVRYKLMEAPRFVYTCHCTDCQTLTTSAFTLSAPVKRSTLQIIKGQLKTWLRTTTESGRPTRQFVCAACGVRIYSEPRQTPDNVTLRVGTLDDTSWLKPAAAIWMQSAQPWVRLPDNMITCQKGFDDIPAIITRYKEIMAQG